MSRHKDAAMKLIQMGASRHHHIKLHPETMQKLRYFDQETSQLGHKLVHSKEKLEDIIKLAINQTFQEIPAKIETKYGPDLAIVFKVTIKAIIMCTAIFFNIQDFENAKTEAEEHPLVFFSEKFVDLCLETA